MDFRRVWSETSNHHIAIPNLVSISNTPVSNKVLLITTCIRLNEIGRINKKFSFASFVTKLYLILVRTSFNTGDTVQPVRTNRFLNLENRLLFKIACIDILHILASTNQLLA